MALPEVEIELLAERELAPELPGRRVDAGGAALPAPRETTPGAGEAAELSVLWQAARQRGIRLAARVRTHALQQQTSPNPRVNSVVRRFIWEDADTCLDLLGALRDHPLRPRPAHLDIDVGALQLHHEHHDYRIRTRLRVPWSLGRYRVWLSLEPWWGTRSVIGIELSSRRRIRYSRRYFDASHDALREVVECMGAPIGPRSDRPPLRPPRAAAAT